MGGRQGTQGELKMIEYLTVSAALTSLDCLQEVHGRTVTILQHSSKVYAVDTSCFHQGGPLGTEGDIEDINGVACLRCPWHGYRVSSRPLLDLCIFAP